MAEIDLEELKRLADRLRLQRLPSEMDSESRDTADWESGYRGAVKDCRNAADTIEAQSRRVLELEEERATATWQAYMDALSARNKVLARVLELAAERDAWRDAAQDITPGGSEFTTPAECLERARQIRTDLHEARCATVRERRRAEGLAAEVERLNRLQSLATTRLAEYNADLQAAEAKLREIDSHLLECGARGPVAVGPTEARDAYRLAAAPCAPQSENATDDLIDRFAVAMKAKLNAAAEKYGYSDNWTRAGWRDELVEHLMEQIRKGDPRDVAAYCAFAWHHGWSVAPQPEAPMEWSEVATLLSTKFPEYMPTADAAYRFIRSNPETSASFLIDTLKLSTDTSRCSNGKLREIWKLAGGMIDKKAHAWIESDLLPGVLRLLGEIPPAAVARNGGGALSEIHRDLVYEEVAKCVDAVAIIIRASARPGLTDKETAAIKWAKARLAACWIAFPSGAELKAATIREFEAAFDVLDRLTQEPKA